jgi:hypothetical protein
MPRNSGSVGCAVGLVIATAVVSPAVAALSKSAGDDGGGSTGAGGTAAHPAIADKMIRAVRNDHR